MGSKNISIRKEVRRLFMIVSAMLFAESCSNTRISFNDGTIKVRVKAADTKGTVTTTDGLMETGAFSMMSYLSDDYNEEGGDPEFHDLTSVDGLYFSGDGNVTLGSGSWSIAGEPRCVAGVETYFWAWHPVSVPGRGNIVPVKNEALGTKYKYTGALGFSYTTPTPSPDNATKDADVAEDLLFAYSKKSFSGDDDGFVDITFHHALAQVRFCVSTDDGTFDKSLIIENISISNLKTSGNGLFSDSGNAENNAYAYDSSHDSYDQFTWNSQTGNKTFGQDYNADFSTSTVAGWTKGSYTKSSKKYNLYTCENVFFMIPQAVTMANNSMTVTFDYNGEKVVKTVPITDEDGDTWLGDYYYTYKIKATTVGRDIDFSVSLVGWTNRKEEIFI